MRSSTPDAPAQVPADQVAGEAPAAGNVRPAAVNAWLADLASFTAQIVAAILGCPPF